MVVQLIERGVPQQSTHAPNAAQLVQNLPYCEIQVKLVECPYLWCKRKPAVEYFARNSAALRSAKRRKVKLLRNFAMKNSSGVAQILFPSLKILAMLGADSVNSTAGIGNASFVFNGDS